MKKSLFLLLIAVAFVSCTKEVIEIHKTCMDKPSTGTPKDTTKKDTVKKDTSTKTTTSIILTVDPNNTGDHTVQGMASSTLQGVTIGMFDMNVQGNTGTLGALPVHLVVKNNGTGAPNAVVTTLRLYDSAGHQIDSEYVPSGTDPEVVFKNTNFKMVAGTTSVLTVKADIAPIDGTIVTTGVSVQVDISAAEFAQAVVYSDDQLIFPSTDFSGSFTGSNIYLYVAGINITSNGATTITYSNPGGSQVHGTSTMVIPFAVTAFGKNWYMSSATQRVIVGSVNAPTATAGNYIQYAVDNGSTLSQNGDIASATITYTGNDVLTVDANGNYQIPVGQTKTFNLVITYTAATTGSYRGQLVNVNANSTDSGSDYISFSSLLNSNLFRTGYVAAQ